MTNPSPTPSGLRTLLIGAALIAPLTLAGCAPEPGAAVGADSSDPGLVTAPETTEENDASPATETAEPRTQVEDCGWEGGQVTSLAAAPGSQDGDLHAVIVGAWQHTAIDDGSGFEPLDSEDIRYVFPSPDRLLYCQHIPGVLEHLHNAADISWDGTRIVVPGGAPGFEVLEWNDSTMVWTNHMDGTTYLLQRR